MDAVSVLQGESSVEGQLHNNVHVLNLLSSTLYTSQIVKI